MTRIFLDRIGWIKLIRIWLERKPVGSTLDSMEAVDHISTGAVGCVYSSNNRMKPIHFCPRLFGIV